MTDAHLTDRIPDVAAGREGWTEAEAAHLARCAECAAEWEVVVRYAGRASEYVSAAEGIADAVLQRLRETPVTPMSPRRRRWARPVALLAAASVVIALLVQVSPPGDEAGLATLGEPTMLPELDGLVDAELEVLLAALLPPDDAPVIELPRLGDLTDEELALLLEEVGG